MRDLPRPFILSILFILSKLFFNPIAALLRDVHFNPQVAELAVIDR